MPIRVRRLAFLAPVLFALTACGGGGDEGREETSTTTNVVTTETHTNTVETAPAVSLPPATSNTGEEHAPRRNVRDGPGEERAPEYEGARSAATALPSRDDDASPPEASPPPPPPSPSGPQSSESGR